MEPLEDPLLEIIELLNLTSLRLMVCDLDGAGVQGWQNHIALEVARGIHVALEVARVIGRIYPGIGPGY